jgi:inorganic triphosphatase YgiF
LARECQRRTGGELDLRSKSERGYRLADGDDQAAAHAEPIQLRPEMTAKEAFNVVAIRRCGISLPMQTVFGPSILRPSTRCASGCVD